jgi:serine/threonine protein kinase
MELLEGFPLEKLIQQKVRLTVSQIIRLGREIARGLAAAHEKGLVHRDIKPANIWLEIVSDDPGSDKKLYRVKILDFGMARLQEQTQGLTRHGIVVGTPLYMSPEQASGSKIDGRSDLFSLGVVLYELCTGKLPFQGETAVGVMSALASENPPPVREVNPEIPKKLSRIIDRLLAKLPDDRPPNALNVARLLDGLERGDSGETVADSSLRDAAAPAEGKAAEGSGPVPSLDSTASLPVRLQLPNLFPYLVASVVLNVVCLIVIAYLVGKLF